MAERELYNNWDSKVFPFDYVRSTYGASLAAILRRFEQEDQYEPHANFVTAINAVLVWTGARTATLPSWCYCDGSRILELINHLNSLSRQISQKVGLVDELFILNRPQVYRSGDGIQQALIVRQNCSRVRLTIDPPVGDDEIGRELDMYHPNVEHFAAGYDLGDTAFSVWEAGAHALLYAEAWSEHLLSSSQLKEFVAHCERRLSIWNSTMEKLGLTYRFYGTMDWKRSEASGLEALKTRQFCGKEVLGLESRGKEPNSPRVNDIKHPTITKRSSLRRSIIAAA